MDEAQAGQRLSQGLGKDLALMALELLYLAADSRLRGARLVGRDVRDVRAQDGAAGAGYEGEGEDVGARSVQHEKSFGSRAELSLEGPEGLFGPGIVAVAEGVPRIGRGQGFHDLGAGPGIIIAGEAFHGHDGRHYSPGSDSSQGAAQTFVLTISTGFDIFFARGPPMEAFRKLCRIYVLASLVVLMLGDAPAVFAMGGAGSAPWYGGSGRGSGTDELTGPIVSPGVMPLSTWSGFLVDKISGQAKKNGDVDLTTSPQSLSRKVEIADSGLGFGISILQGGSYKFIPFDGHGNTLASQLIFASKQDSAPSIVVNGTIMEGILKVYSIVESNS